MLNILTDLIKFSAESQGGAILKQIDVLIGKRTGMEK